jgi:predicted CXXCH cytochrome family protein
MSQGGANSRGIGGNADSPGTEGIDLGTDLSNDHPISVQYCGGGIDNSTTYAGGSTGNNASGVNSATNMQNSNGGVMGAFTVGDPVIASGTCRDRLFNLPTTQMIGSQTRFWVDTNVIPDQDAIDAHAASIHGQGANPITRDPETVELYVTDGTTLATANTKAYATSHQTNSSAVGANACGTGTNGDACGRGFIPVIKGGTSVTASTLIAGFGVRTKQDIMLFTNNPGVRGPSVECASCHDPHTPNNGTFLRVSNNQSGLCLSCHVK